MNKKNLRFVKDYKIDSKKNSKTMKKVEDFQSVDDEKSIESINESVKEFESNLEERKLLKRDIKETRYKYNKRNILSNTRWFSGMSTFYLDRPRKSETENPEPVASRNNGYDF